VGEISSSTGDNGAPRKDDRLLKIVELLVEDMPQHIREMDQAEE
jgi:hypothetical protein